MTAWSDHLPAPSRIFIKSVAKADESAPSRFMMEISLLPSRSGVRLL